MLSQVQVRRVIGSFDVITTLSVFIWWSSRNHGIDKCQCCVCLYVCRAKHVDMCGRTEGSHMVCRLRSVGSECAGARVSIDDHWHCHVLMHDVTIVTWIVIHEAKYEHLPL